MRKVCYQSFKGGFKNINTKTMVTLAQCEEMRYSLHTDSPLRLSSDISCVIQPQWFAALTCNHQCIYIYIFFNFSLGKEKHSYSKQMTS